MLVRGAPGWDPRVMAAERNAVSLGLLRIEHEWEGSASGADRERLRRALEEGHDFAAPADPAASPGPAATGRPELRIAVPVPNGDAPFKGSWEYHLAAVSTLPRCPSFLLSPPTPLFLSLLPRPCDPALAPAHLREPQVRGMASNAGGPVKAALRKAVAAATAAGSAAPAGVVTRIEVRPRLGLAPFLGGAGLPRPSPAALCNSPALTPLGHRPASPPTFSRTTAVGPLKPPLSPSSTSFEPSPGSTRRIGSPRAALPKWPPLTMRARPRATLPRAA